MTSARALVPSIVKVPAGKQKSLSGSTATLFNWFRDVVDSAGGGNYQTLMNQALRDYIEGRTPKMQDTFRRILRQESKAKHDAA
jgi:hypothetical protein